MYSLMYYFMYRCALRVTEVCSTSSSETMILFRNVAYCGESDTITIRLLSNKHSNKASVLLKLPCNKKLKVTFCNYVKLPVSNRRLPYRTDLYRFGIINVVLADLKG